MTAHSELLARLEGAQGLTSIGPQPRTDGIDLADLGFAGFVSGGAACILRAEPQPDGEKT